MVDNDLREDICDQFGDSCVLFDNPSFDGSIIGVTSDGAVVYDYEMMVQECMKDENWSEEDAVEWIDYNTIRSIPYSSSIGTPPVVVFQIIR